MNNRNRRSRPSRTSDVWRYPGMDTPSGHFDRRDNDNRRWNDGERFNPARQGGHSDGRDYNNRNYPQRGYYHEPSGYPQDRGGYNRNDSDRYYDSDIYEQDFGPRNENDYRRMDDDRDYGNYHPRDSWNRGRRWDEDGREIEYNHRDPRGFFERAGERIREVWQDWRGREEPRGYFGGPFNEDDNERRYGRDNWAPNSNRGTAPRRNRRRRQYSNF